MLATAAHVYDQFNRLISRTLETLGAGSGFAADQFSLSRKISCVPFFLRKGQVRPRCGELLLRDSEQLCSFRFRAWDVLLAIELKRGGGVTQRRRDVAAELCGLAT